MEVKREIIKDLISALMLSELYFDLPLAERLRLVRRLAREHR